MSVNMEVQEMKNENTDETVDFNEMQVPTKNESTTSVPKGEGEAGGKDRPLLVDMQVTNENTALNLIVGFLNVAQRRGAFNFKESGKISECIDMFVRGNN